MAQNWRFHCCNNLKKLFQNGLDETNHMCTTCAPFHARIGPKNKYGCIAWQSWWRNIVEMGSVLHKWHLWDISKSGTFSIYFLYYVLICLINLFFVKFYLKTFPIQQLIEKGHSWKVSCGNWRNHFSNAGIVSIHSRRK